MAGYLGDLQPNGKKLMALHEPGVRKFLLFCFFTKGIHRVNNLLNNPLWENVLGGIDLIGNDLAL